MPSGLQGGKGRSNRIPGIFPPLMFPFSHSRKFRKKKAGKTGSVKKMFGDFNSGQKTNRNAYVTLTHSENKIRKKTIRREGILRHEVLRLHRTTRNSNTDRYRQHRPAHREYRTMDYSGRKYRERLCINMNTTRSLHFCQEWHMVYHTITKYYQ